MRPILSADCAGFDLDIVSAFSVVPKKFKANKYVPYAMNSWDRG